MEKRVIIRQRTPSGLRSGRALETTKYLLILELSRESPSTAVMVPTRSRVAVATTRSMVAAVMTRSKVVAATTKSTMAAPGAKTELKIPVEDVGSGIIATSLTMVKARGVF